MHPALGASDHRPCAELSFEALQQGSAAAFVDFPHPSQVPFEVTFIDE